MSYKDLVVSPYLNLLGIANGLSGWFCIANGLFDWFSIAKSFSD